MIAFLRDLQGFQVLHVLFMRFFVIINTLTLLEFLQLVSSGSMILLTITFELSIILQNI